MPVAIRLETGKLSFPVVRVMPKPTEAPEERWWFPLGSITRIGAGVFRWHCVSEDPRTKKPFIFSGRLDVYDNIGHMLDEDMDEGDADLDPMQAWYEDLPPFPYCHLFFDTSLDYNDIDLGPWFCMHAVYGKSRISVEMDCLTGK